MSTISVGSHRDLAGQPEHSAIILASLSGLASLVSALLSLGLATVFFRRRFTDPVAAVLWFYLLLYAVLMAGPLAMWSSYWRGDDFWIETEQGQKAFKIDGRALRVRQTLVFEDAPGNELAKIQERMLRVKDSMEIEGPHGEQLAMAKKALITPVRERWVVKIKGGPDLEVKGNILDHERTIGEGRDKSGGGVQEVVPPARQLRRCHRSWTGERDHPDRVGVHRRDGARRPPSQRANEFGEALLTAIPGYMGD